MAENQDENSREDLSDEASPYRIEEFRRRGIVAQSREVTSVLALLATFMATYLIAPQAGGRFLDFMRDVFQADLSSRLDLASISIQKTYILKSLSVAAMIGLPILLAGFFMGIIGSFAQVGSLFSTEPLQPDVTRIDPVKGLQRLLSVRQLIEAVRMIFKAIVIVFVAYQMVKSEIFSTIGAINQSPNETLHYMGRTSAMIFGGLILVLLVFAVIDYGFQRWEWSKKVRLTKAEAKQELKEREGDPHIKARIRSIQREMTRRRMMTAVKNADVVITNPTHIAIAISYQKNSMAAPKVVAKGADYIAQQIKKIALEAGVPMVENVPLARTLFKTVKLNHSIPRSLYQAVAEVLAYVYRLKGTKST